MPSKGANQEQMWYDASEVAKHLGVHVTSIKRIPETDLPYMRYGKRGDRKYHKKDIENYISSRMVGE